METFYATITQTDAINEALDKAKAALEEAKEAAEEVAEALAKFSAIDPDGRYMEKFFPLTKLEEEEEKKIWEAMSQLCIGNDEGDAFELFIGLVLKN